MDAATARGWLEDQGVLTDDFADEELLHWAQRFGALTDATEQENAA